jgi:hypothetical protein
MKTTPVVLAIVLLACFAAEADEASDSSCVSAAVSRLPATPGATVTKSRVSEPARMAGVPEDKFARKVEIHVHSESRDAIYIFMCSTEPGKESALRLMGIW